MVNLKEIFNRFKPAYQLYNMLNAGKLKHVKAHYQQLGLNKSFYASVSSSDFQDMPKDAPVLDKEDSRTVLQGHSALSELNDAHKEALLDWSTNGFAVLENYVSEEDVDQVNKEVDELIESGESDWRFGENRIMFAVRQSAAIKNIGKGKELNNVLDALLHRQVDLFQSINFIKGTNQRTHSDSIHMTTYPLGNLIGVWVALEDIGPDQGPLHYYPGSHKLPYVLNADFNTGNSRWMLGDQIYENYENKIAEVIQENKLQKQVFTPKKGDVLIWHANLLHGAEIQTNPSLTRKSMVFHYYANDVFCYHELTQRPSQLTPF